MVFSRRSERPSEKRKFVHSLNSALEGIIHTLKSERNMRVHFSVGFLVLMAGIYLKLSNVEFMFLCLAVFFVLVCEMFNTAVEYTVDLINDEFHPLAKIVKDIAAGAVFVAAINAVITGYILLVKSLGEGVVKDVAPAIRQSPSQLTIVAILMVIVLVIGIKVRRREKSLLKGGMPSGHSAVAFSVWMIVFLLSQNVIVSVLVFALALLVARSRVEKGVHTIWEVIAGSLLGGLITLLLFQLLS
jgi:diacylglycerol kinase (ATP)